MLAISVDNILKFFSTYERHISIATLVGGFIFDSFTLRRADLLPENLALVGYLFLITICLCILSFGDAGKFAGEKARKLFVDFHPWLLFAMQFAFGGLASAFLIFYSRSTSIFASWPFLLVFVAYMIANEVLRKHYALFAVRIAAFFFALFSYLIFLFPILFKQISVWMFLSAQVASLVLVGALIFWLSFVNGKEVHQGKKLLSILIGSIVVLVNGLYFFALIPPVPLLLQQAGAYQLVEKTSDGTYVVVGEKARVLPFIQLPQKIHLVEGDPLYVFASIYSPSKIDTSVVHKWQHFNEESREWEVLSTITIPIVGGREDGYRTYSSKSFVPEGKWKVDVSLQNGQTIGRVEFSVENVFERPALVSEVK